MTDHDKPMASPEMLTPATHGCGGATNGSRINPIPLGFCYSCAFHHRPGKRIAPEVHVGVRGELFCIHKVPA